MRKTKIISLYAGPGAGKSTFAAELFAKYKKEGKLVELVREYVKDWVWEGRNIGTYEQIYFLGKQARMESRLLGKVDYIITDSPVWLAAYYAGKYAPTAIAGGCWAMANAYYMQVGRDGHEHVHCWKSRDKAYVQEGRRETEGEARVVDDELRKFLAAAGIHGDRLQEHGGESCNH